MQVVRLQGDEIISGFCKIQFLAPIIGNMSNISVLIFRIELKVTIHGPHIKSNDLPKSDGNREHKK